MRNGSIPYFSKWTVGLTFSCLVLFALIITWWSSSTRTWNIGHVVLDISISPNGKLVAAAETTEDRLHQVLIDQSRQASETQAVKLRRVPDGTVERVLMGHKDDIWTVEFSPDGQLLATGSADHTVKVWQVHDGKLITTLDSAPATPRSLAFDPHGQILAVSDETETRFWSTQEWTVRRRLPPGATVFSPDSQLVANLADHVVKIWRVEDGVLLRSIQARYASSNVSWSSNGQWLAFAVLRDVQIWRVSDGEHIATLTGHTNVVNSIVWSPDGKLLATASGATPSLLRGPADHTIRLWQAQNWQPLMVFSAHDDIVRALAFTPDAQWLVSGSQDGKIRWWDVRPEVISQ